MPLRAAGCLAVLGLALLTPRVWPLGPAAALPHTRAKPKILLGIDALEREHFRPLQGLRVGLVANRASRDGRGRSTAAVLAAAPGVRLVEILSLEHGFFVDTQANSIGSSAIKLDGRSIPVHSLYRGGITDGMRPTAADLQGVDALVFDVQDVGVRYYTYIASMGMAMEAAQKAGARFIVLDRPDPLNGKTIEGPVSQKAILRQETARNYFPIPIRYAMTCGEIARFYAAKLKYSGLSVVRMSGWKRSMWYDQTGLAWTPPSPALPNLNSAILYPGMGMLDASNLSAGRGTPEPFQWFGAPWLKADAMIGLLDAAHLPGVRFSREYLVPRTDIYAGRRCAGVKMTVVNRDRLKSVDVFAHVAAALMALQPKKARWDWKFLDQLAGTTRINALLKNRAGAASLERALDPDLKLFEKSRRPFLLY
ncbi:MAG TPA: DUF1343 domain-containing protein [Elusimicrobiota bacterium]|nr:DUF1343 domain-containing protein [Elusimicrobiota bacterium]